MINKYEERLGTERMLPLIFKMALPAVAAQFVNLLYSIVDRVYIGHIPGIGTDALAGVGVTTSLIILISSFSAIVGGGGAPLAAIALGQGDRVRAGKILGNGFVLLILFTLLTSFIAYTFMEPILLFTGASANTLEYAVDYLSIYLLGTGLQCGLGTDFPFFQTRLSAFGETLYETGQKNNPFHIGFGSFSVHYGEHGELGRVCA